MTSEALMIAVASFPGRSPSCSAASFVIDADIIAGLRTSILTIVVTAPLWTSVTTPLSWFLALSFIRSPSEVDRFRQHEIQQGKFRHRDTTADSSTRLSGGSALMTFSSKIG